MRKHGFAIKSAALLLCIIGAFVFLLEGHHSHRSIYNYNYRTFKAHSYWGLLLVLPYILVVIYDNFFRKADSKIKPEPASIALQEMETMEIDLRQCVVGISEYSEEIPGLSRAFKELYRISEDEMPKPILQHESVVFFKIKLVQ